jgi:Domain of unknown function (DUF4145)
MPVNRALWRASFSDGNHPGWPCPKCHLGVLVFSKGSLAVCETAESVSNQSEGYDNSDEMFEGRFVCLFICSRGACGEPVAVTGTAARDVDHKRQVVEPFYVPRFFTPAPPLINIPEKCPQSIRLEAQAAFTLYWCDYGASLNRVRNAIELLLTEMRIKRYGQKKGGGRSRLPLDSRIQALRAKKPTLSGLCDRMLAVKHLGNAGSHPGQVQGEDVFDAMDILEDILLEKYPDRKGVLASMVRQINRRKGPRKTGK